MTLPSLDAIRQTRQPIVIRMPDCGAAGGCSIRIPRIDGPCVCRSMAIDLAWQPCRHPLDACLAVFALIAVRQAAAGR